MSTPCNVKCRACLYLRRLELVGSALCLSISISSLLFSFTTSLNIKSRLLSLNLLQQTVYIEIYVWSFMNSKGADNKCDLIKMLPVKKHLCMLSCDSTVGVYLQSWVASTWDYKFVGGATENKIRQKKRCI